MPTINYTHYYDKIERLGEPDSPTYKDLRKEQLTKKDKRDKEALQNDNRFPDF